MTSTPNTSPASERVPEMVERVAKAFYLGMHGSKGADWQANDCKDIWIAGARAAIAAMREPTGPMIEALQTQWPGGTGSDATRWRCMIEAALR